MIPCMVGKLAPNSSYYIRGLAKYKSSGGAVFVPSPPKTDKLVTSPPPPQSLNDSSGTGWRYHEIHLLAAGDVIRVLGSIHDPVATRISEIDHARGVELLDNLPIQYK